jgi:hypothetical protein
MRADLIQSNILRRRGAAKAQHPSLRLPLFFGKMEFGEGCRRIRFCRRRCIDGRRAYRRISDRDVGAFRAMRRRTAAASRAIHLPYIRFKLGRLDGASLELI